MSTIRKATPVPGPSPDIPSLSSSPPQATITAIAIGLKAFNDFTFRSLAETINDLDPERKIVGEHVQFPQGLLPTPKEIQAIRKYKDEGDKLITAEIFFRQLVPVKQIEDKVRAMRTVSALEEHVEDVRAGFQALRAACAQVIDSKRLIQVLEMVLAMGNLMNEGKMDGGVNAFKFESLPRLGQTKSADGKSTVLYFIVETFTEKGERQALLLAPELPDIQACPKVTRAGCRSGTSWVTLMPSETITSCARQKLPA